MSDENKEINFPEGAEDEAVPEAEVKPDGEWQWDAAVPETQTDNITFDELSHQSVQETEENEAVDAEPETEDEAEAEEEKEESEDDFCIVCGNHRGDSPSELYCNECREKFLRTDYGAGHVIFAFIMVIVAAIAYFVFITTGSFALKVSSAENLLKDNRFNDAVSLCEEVKSDVDTVNSGINSVFTTVNKGFIGKDWFAAGSKLDKICLDAYVDILSTSNSEHENFVAMVESMFTDKNSKFDYSKLEKSEYAKIKNAYDFCKELIDAGATYTAGLQSFVSYNDDSSMKIDYNKAMTYIDGLDPKTSAQKAMADYCRFIAAFYAEKNADTIFGFFDSACENAGEFGYMFYQTYIEVAYEKEEYSKVVEMSQKSIERNPNDINAFYFNIQAYTLLGELDSADKACEEMKKFNPDGLDYYAMKAGVLRRQGDFEGAVKICKDGIAEGEDAEIYRQQAIAYMLLDNKDSALEAVKQSYEIAIQSAYSGSNSYNLVENLNTAALITCICGDDKTYDEIIAIFENEGVSLNKSVQDCIKGEITFEDIFMKGTGEV